MLKQSAKKLQRKSAFSRIALNHEYEANVMLYDSFVLSNFNYCPLIWMCNGKSSSNEIDRFRKRAFRVLLDDYGSIFVELLQKKSEHTIHTRNRQTLLLELYTRFSYKNPPSCEISSNVGPQITILE